MSDVHEPQRNVAGDGFVDCPQRCVDCGVGSIDADYYRPR
jgi:hypothetical protein